MEFLKDGRLPFVEFILAFHHIFNQCNREQQNKTFVFSFHNQNQSLFFYFWVAKHIKTKAYHTQIFLPSWEKDFINWFHQFSFVFCDLIYIGCNSKFITFNLVLLLYLKKPFFRIGWKNVQSCISLHKWNILFMTIWKDEKQWNIVSSFFLIL